MGTRIALTLLLFIIIQTVLMGVGVVVILMTPTLSAHAMNSFLPMVEITAVISIIGSFILAPRLRALNEGSV